MTRTQVATALTLALALVDGCDAEDRQSKSGTQCAELLGNECTPTDTDDGCPESLCGPLKVFDSSGCPRVPCTSDADCAGDETCYLAAQDGACNSSMIRCVDEGSGCECAGNNDCGGKYCVSTVDIP